MVLNSDLKIFYENLKATKPPYECPVKECGKIYKTFAGIENHLCNYDHENPENNSTGSPSGSPSKGGGRRGALSHKQSRTPISSCQSGSHQLFNHSLSNDVNIDAEEKLFVEVDIGGKNFRIGVFEPLNIIIEDNSDDSVETDAVVKSGPSCVAKSNNLVAKDTPRKDTSLSPGRLPEAIYRVLDNCAAPKNVPAQSSSYHRYVEKSQEEQDEEVVYDMDEEVTKVLVT